MFTIHCNKLSTVVLLYTTLILSLLCVKIINAQNANIAYDDVAQKKLNETFASASSVAAATSSLAQSLSTPAKISATLSSLGKVLNRMFDQIEADERVYQEFKQELLQQEVNAADVDLSWPAIKDLVSTEVKSGRANMEAQVSQFKIEVLDMVQKGLDALRADLRATVLTGFAPNKQPQKTTVNLDLMTEGAAAVSNNARNNNTKNATLSNQLADFVDSIDCSDNCKQDIRNFIQQKIQQQDDYGQSPFDALREMQNVLQGRLSSRDIRAELYQRLEELTRDYLRHPSPVAKQALESLRTVMIAALNATNSNTTSTPNEPMYDADRTRSELPRRVPDYPSFKMSNDDALPVNNDKSVLTSSSTSTTTTTSSSLISSPVANMYMPAQTEADIVTTPNLSKLEQIKQQLEELERAHNN